MAAGLLQKFTLLLIAQMDIKREYLETLNRSTNGMVLIKPKTTAYSNQLIYLITNSPFFIGNYKLDITKGIFLKAHCFWFLFDGKSQIDYRKTDKRYTD